MFLPYLPIVKGITQIAAGMGASKIVADIVKNNVVISTPVQAVTVKVGSFVLGSMLWEQSSKHVESAVADAVETIQKMKRTPPSPQ